MMNFMKLVVLCGRTSNNSIENHKRGSNPFDSYGKKRQEGRQTVRGSFSTNSRQREGKLSPEE